MMSVIVLGANGQVGQELRHSELSSLFDVRFWDRSKFDLANDDHYEQIVQLHPDWVINCAAYTKVDQAEEDIELAYRINAEAPRMLAEACKQVGAKLIHLSSDYVYDNALTRPLKETDPCMARSIYAKSKLLGDQQVRDVLCDYYIIRTSWVYSTFGHNFVKTMLRLSQTRSELSIVDDQHGAPTYAKDIAAAIIQMIKIQPTYGIYNFSNSGACTWLDFARSIFENRGTQMTLHPISTYDFGAKAPRPHYSVLDCSKFDQAMSSSFKRRAWNEALTETLSNLSEQELQ